jgi:hypothetical protein
LLEEDELADVGKMNEKLPEVRAFEHGAVEHFVPRMIDDGVEFIAHWATFTTLLLAGKIDADADRSQSN